jgi:hypothetical protein
VVLTGDDASFVPGEFREELFGSALSYQFPVVRLRDLPPERLAESNVFATVSRIQLAANELSRVREDGARLARKVALTQEFYRHGYSRKQVVQLYRFLDYVVRLPPDLEVEYRQELERIEGSTNMPYVTSIERLAKREGLKQGEVRGLTKGRQEGARALRESVLETLEARFGQVPDPVRQALDEVVDLDELRRVLRRAVTVSTLADFSA